MFKQIIIISLISLIIVFIFLKKNKDIPDNKLIKQKIKKPIKGICTKNHYTLKNFYTDTPWIITPDGKSNYIHDTINDKYYIIEPGYLYNITTDDIKVYIENKDINIININ